MVLNSFSICDTCTTTMCMDNLSFMICLNLRVLTHKTRAYIPENSKTIAFTSTEAGIRPCPHKNEIIGDLANCCVRNLANELVLSAQEYLITLFDKCCMVWTRIIE